MSQPLAARNIRSASGEESALPIRLAYAIAANPQTALPSVSNVGTRAFFFICFNVHQMAPHCNGEAVFVAFQFDFFVPSSCLRVFVVVLEKATTNTPRDEGNTKKSK